MKKIYRYFFISLVIVILIIGIIAGVAVMKVRKLANSPIMTHEEILFTLKPGTGRVALGTQLYEQKLIEQPKLFQLLLKYQPDLAKFKAGTYRLEPNITVEEMLKRFASGKEAQFSVRFIEGTRLQDVLNTLREAPYIQQTLKEKESVSLVKDLGIKDPTWLEGWFYPDTWMYTANTSDIELLHRVHKKMIDEVEKIWQQRDADLPYKTQNELVTMASIIEKETAVASEREAIASVFVNRLRKGMLLQTDPTVIYGMGDEYKGKISKKDLETSTPYNTYIISGIPPGPIALPSLASLQAAAHPAKTPYLYFVADGKGGHNFSTNLADHNRAVKQYLKWRKENNGQ